MFNPSSSNCVALNCKGGYYDTKTSVAGWVAYIGKLGCSDDNGAYAIFNSVTSAEACIEAASKTNEQFVNYKVSNGKCQ
eukprot:Awhi_evm1s2815